MAMTQLQKEMNRLKKKQEKEQREGDLIHRHEDLLRLIFEIYEGQVLNIDLKDVCLQYKFLSSENEYNTAIDRLLNGEVLRKCILRGTQNSVLILKKCVVRHFTGKNNSIDYKELVVRRNCFKTKIIIKSYVGAYADSTAFIKALNDTSTLCHKVYDIDTAYNFFSQNFDMSDLSKEKIEEQRYNQMKAKSHLKNSYVQDLKAPVGADMDKSFCTLINKYIYTIIDKENDKISFFLIDYADEFTCSKISRYISDIIYVLNYGIELDAGDYPSMFKSIEIAICAKNRVQGVKIKNGLVSISVDKNGAEKETHILKNSLNKNIKPYKFNINYDAPVKKASKKIILSNSVKSNFFDLEIKVKNYELDDRLNIYTRLQNLARKNALKKEQESIERAKTSIEKEYKSQIRYELEMEIRAELEAKIRAELEGEMHFDDI